MENESLEYQSKQIVEILAEMVTSYLVNQNEETTEMEE